MDRSSLTGQKETNIANPYSPTKAVEACEQLRGMQLVWVLPIFFVSGALALFFAASSLGIDIMEPHTDASVEYRRNVYKNGIAAIASGAVCAITIVYAVVQRWVPRACLLLLLVPFACMYLGCAVIFSYEADKKYRAAIPGSLTLIASRQVATA